MLSYAKSAYRQTRRSAEWIQKLNYLTLGELENESIVESNESTVVDL